MTSHTTNPPSMATGLVAANVVLTVVACLTVAYLLWINIAGERHLARLEDRIPAPSAAAIELENASLRAELARIKQRIEELQGANAALEARAAEAERALAARVADAASGGTMRQTAGAAYRTRL